MSHHRPPLPRKASFTPPPPIVLDRAPTRAAKRVRPAEPHKSTPAPPAPQKKQRTSLRKRLATLLALIAVPAMAAPGDFGALPGDAPEADLLESSALAATHTLGFERAGESFPGSAFYYLADPPEAALIALPTSDPLQSGAVGDRDIGSVIDAGPAAAAFAAGSGVHYTRAETCLAEAVWYEAASESEAGQRAVAQVVLNRVAHPSWPGSVCGVVYEGSNRSSGCQFSFTCDGSLTRRSPGSLRGAQWAKAKAIAREALNGSVYAPIGHATHYHTLWVDPYWAGSLDPVGVIGAHRFYRTPGPTGEKSAFSTRYSGVEVDVSNPQSVRAAVSEPASLSAAIRRSEPKSDLATGRAPQPPVGGVSPTAPQPQPGQLREEYARAGQWKVDPSTLDLGTDAPTSQDASPNPPAPLTLPPAASDNP